MDKETNLNDVIGRMVGVTVCVWLSFVLLMFWEVCLFVDEVLSYFVLLLRFGSPRRCSPSSVSALSTESAVILGFSGEGCVVVDNVLGFY